MIRGLDSNVLPNAINHASRCVGIVNHICDVLEDDMKIYEESGRHTRPLFNKECSQIIKVLEEIKVFEEYEQRKSDTYKQIKSFFTNLFY